MARSGIRRLAPAAMAAALLAGCKGSGATADAGVEVGPPLGDPMDLVSDFGQDEAVVLPLGTPPRNGYWYSYNDSTCRQSPAHGEPYYPSTPAVPPPGSSGGRALHASWSGCTGWGAGVGADLGLPASGADAGIGSGRPRAPYDLSGFSGFAFWGMAAPGTVTAVRAKLVMRASTQIQDRGICDESVLGPDRCGDEWGMPFDLPADGTWAAVKVRFSDPAFRQEGWGQPFPWNPADVLGIQFQVQMDNLSGLYDFWIDDVYLLR
jgi:hypothetical protein